MSADIKNKISIYKMQYNTEDEKQEIIEKINKIIQTDNNTLYSVEELDVWGNDEFEWTNRNEFMTRLSKIFPFIIFTVDINYYGGDGFERIYYQNGKSHSVEGIITFEKFDKNKLK